jgi:hypothetical protein
VLAVEGRVLAAPAGSFAFVPRGVAHAFANPSGGVARFVELDAPAGFGRYVERLAEAFPAGSQLDPATVAAVQAEHDTHPPHA